MKIVPDIPDYYVDRARWCGLLMFAAAGFEFPGVAGSAALLLLVVAFARHGDCLRACLQRPVFQIPLLFALWVLVRAGLRYLEMPAERDLILEWTGYYIVASGLPALVLAALLAADRRRILWVLNAALAALLLSLIAHSGVDDIRAYMSGQRAFYGLGNASSLYIVTGMLGVVLFAPWGKARDAASRFALGYSCLALILLSLALVWQQNRSVLVAALVVIPLVGYLRFGRRSATAGPNRGLGLFVAVLFLAVLLVFVGGLRDRFAAGLETVQPEPAVSERMRLWQVGWESVLEHPFMGSGPGSVSQLVRTDELVNRHSQLHNLYLQLLVETGLVGLLLYCLLLVVLVRALRYPYPASDGGEVTLFAGGALALFLLVNLTQIRIDGEHAMFYVTLLYALIMTAALNSRTQDPGVS